MANITAEKEANILAKVKNGMRRANARAKNTHSLYRVENARSLEEIAPALRELAHPDTKAPENVARKALELSEKYKLAGKYPG